MDKVAFTGSTEVGRLIVQAASRDLRKVSLELGGKSPNIILDDADIDAAIAGATAGIFFNHGQCCNAGSRLFVQEKIFDKVVAGIAANAAKIKLGVGMDPATEMGPLVSRSPAWPGQGLSQVRPGRRRARPDRRFGAGRQRGYFVQPTVLVDTKPDMKVVREEIFGPVLVATPFKEVDDKLIAAANDTIYGLAAGVWTPRHRQGQPARQCHQGRHGVDQLLPCVRRRPALWRLQAVGLGPRNGPGGAVELSGGQGDHDADWVTCFPSPLEGEDEKSLR